MPLENAVSIAELNPTLPLGTDPVASADDHIRLIKAVLKSTFPNITTPLTVSTQDLNTRGVPSGFIGLWSGLATAIPSGWFLCNGQNSTPDLRDRFVVGAGGNYSVAAVGGAINASTSTAGAHTHALSSAGAHTHTGLAADHTLTLEEIPSHNHETSWGESNVGDSDFGAGATNGHAGSGETDHDNYHFLTSTVGGSKAHRHDLTIDSAGAHTHDLTAAGDHSHTVDTRSPYYALCYIMKG